MRDSLVVICVTKSALLQVASVSIKPQYMRELDIPEISAILNHSLTQVASKDTKHQHMKVLGIPVISAVLHHSVI